MKNLMKWVLLLALGPLFPTPAAAYTVVSTANKYMVENTPGKDPNGNTCYDFITTPSCSAIIPGISSGSLPSGSTFYIQNTLNPTTATQQFSVQQASSTRVDTSTANVTQALLLNGSAGTSGQVLTSNGAGVAPTYQATSTAILNSTNTWTASQQFSSATFKSVLSSTGPFNNWTSFTPTGSWATNTTYTGFWRREGSDMEVFVHIALTGAPNSTNLQLTVPISASVDATLPQNQDVTYYGQAGASHTGGHLFFVAAGASATSLDVLFISSVATAATSLVTQAAPFTFGNGDFIDAHFTIPIAGWGW